MGKRNPRNTGQEVETVGFAKDSMVNIFFSAQTQSIFLAIVFFPFFKIKVEMWTFFFSHVDFQDLWGKVHGD